uniref:Uncharacterized protein n=1 Tax=viral metagenome TaxID=1070528 RepID=A0A6H2A4W7_9ZZZZ
MRQFIIAVLAWICCALFLAHFLLIAIMGSVVIAEPHIPFMVAEVVMFAGFMALAMWEIVSILRRYIK